MANYSDNLASMVGRVRQVKPNAPSNQIRNQINDRIRFIIDQEMFWADLVANTVLSCPLAYVTGQASLFTGSKVVAGTATAWPTHDLSNTTIPNGVPQQGTVQTVTPADMAGIVVNSFLYVDAGGTPETVAVLSTTPSSFTARFAYRHNANCAVTQSSLSGLQLKMGSQYPIFTVTSVHTSTELEIDVAWGTSDLLTAGYSIVKIYFTIADDMKDILNVWDPTQGRPMSFHKSQDYLNYRDPQRMATGVPQMLADFLPTAAGTMRYELWPHQTIPYQIPVLYCRQWPEMRNPTDQPPWFINPSMIIDGAVADALRINNAQVGGDMQDPYFNLKAAEVYEAKFAKGLQAAIGANQSKALNALEPYRRWFGFVPGGSWNQSHLTDDYYADLGW